MIDKAAIRRQRKLLFGFLLVLGAAWLTFTLAGAGQQSLQKPTTVASSADYQLDTVFQTEGVVWSFAFISPDELLATRRDGKFFHVNLATGESTALPTPDVTPAGQGGLLDVHFHPHNGTDYVYLTYSAEVDDKLTTLLSRGIWTGSTIESYETLLVGNTIGNGGRHFGSRLLFHDGYLFMTIGDRGERDYAQDLSQHNGKILRLNLDGSAADGNPFLQNADALPEIWSYGHRNPQGIDTDSNGKIYSVEFGPRGGDELNLIEPEKNYGWPLITYGREYWGGSIGSTEREGLEQPVTHWTPSISPSGMAFYRGDKIPAWQGDLFIANLATTHLRRLVLENGEVTQEEVLFSDLSERIRHVRSAPDGYLYFSTDSGKIIRVSLP